MSKKSKNLLDESKLYFLIFVIHAFSEKNNISPKEVYGIFNKTDIIEKYIIGCYDILHSMGKISIIEDVEEYLENRGVKFANISWFNTRNKKT